MPSHQEGDTTTSKSWVKRALSRVEPALQHDGFCFTFIFMYLLVNVVLFFITGAPAWRATSEESFIFRASSAIARGSAAVLNFNSAAVILVASRALMTYLRRTILNMFVPFDKAMPAFHTLAGNLLVVALLLHTIGHIVRYAMKQLKGPGFLGPTSLAISGSILTVTVLAMKITALKKLRQRSFETFYWTHHVGFVIYFIAVILHGSHNGVLKTWMYVTGPIIIYIIDRCVRLLREKGSRLTITRESAVLKGTDMVCLRIPRAFSYLAGQYCDIKVPLVSSFEWHPFTIASSPHESEMLFFIKVNGDWTRRLYQLFKERDGEHEDVSVHVRGPYGAPAQHVGQYEHVVLVSGGVGATPFASITKYVHHWILNFTSRGHEASNTVSAAFTRNQSVQGTPSLPGTPNRHGSAGYASAAHRSRDPSRQISRNHSNAFPRNISRNFSRNDSRNDSRNASRSLSRSGSGKMERFDSRGMPRSGSGRLERFDSRDMASSNSGRLERFHSRGTSRSGSGRLESYNSGAIERSSSEKTNDSIGIIIQEQRMNQPHGPTPVREASPPSDNGLTLQIPGSNGRGDDDTMRRFLEQTVDADDYARPDDYDAELGNPEAPIPERQARLHDTSPLPGETPPHQTFEIVREYDSSQALFDDEDEEQDITGSRPPGHFAGNTIFHDGFDIDPLELEEGGLELEDAILREQTAASNAYNMLGMSFGPMALMRHMHAQDARKLRSSMVRASMNLMDDAMDAAVWQDRLLFYLHTVTINWLLLWLMGVRFALVVIAGYTEQFKINQLGLGIFVDAGFNVVDLLLAIIVTTPVVGAIVMEVYVNGFENFLRDGIGNSFDLFLLTPLLFVCIILHILNFAGVGTTVPHISKLTVFLIWPVLSWFLLWRIGRTIGSRVVLAQYLKNTHARTKSVDYIWVSKTHEDDSWLVEELLPLAESNIVRLHRFITRHGPKTEPWMLDYEKIPLKTTYSRPDWDDVFGGLVERSRSGSVIGVFFCGPDPMARMIQQAAMKAMAKSVENAIQRNYDQTQHGTREDDLGFAGSRSANRMDRVASVGRTNGDRNGPGSRPQQGDDSGDPAAYGCSVRIAVRIENFT